MRKITRLSTAVATVLLRLAANSPAFAQEVEEVVVTAQKRSENLQDVPLSVAAVTGETLQAAGIDRASDLGRVVPGLRFNVSAGISSPGTFLHAHFGLSGLQVGTVIGAMSGIVGGIGLFGRGMLFDAVNRRWPKRALWTTVATLILSAAIAPVGFLASSWQLAAVFIGLSRLLYLFILVPTIAAAQAVAPSNMRAMASALIALSGSLVGATLGPLLAGVFSDALAPYVADRALTYALCIMAAFQLAGAAFYARAKFLAVAPAAADTAH